MSSILNSYANLSLNDSSNNFLTYSTDNPFLSSHNSSTSFNALNSESLVGNGSGVARAMTNPNRFDKRRRDRRHYRRARRTSSQVILANTDFVTPAAAPPPPPPPSVNTSVVPASNDGTGDNGNIRQTNPSGPMSTQDLRLSLYGLVSPLHITVRPVDLITLHYPRGRTGKAIKRAITDSMWLALQRLYSVIVQAANAYVDRCPVMDPFNAPVITEAPNDLFLRLGVARPDILDKIDPTLDNPLQFTYPTPASAIASWTFYQRLALDTMEWISIAYALSFNTHPSLAGVAEILRIENEFSNVTEVNPQAMVLHPTASSYAQAHAEYNPYAGSIVLDATV
ncbi:hypothetical protein CVT24_004911 [Panaeolus cyanescens]|uniref:Uncharacterized protein n=1 Tax=Panaeolus cyanescens TaxID=181874 RepID=A0A409WG72_9AGAR|nr:hypothetical protein CVT24_004911 [Panaeolus cyanescens]